MGWNVKLVSWLYCFFHTLLLACGQFQFFQGEGLAERASYFGQVESQSTQGCAKEGIASIQTE